MLCANPKTSFPGIITAQDHLHPLRYAHVRLRIRLVSTTTLRACGSLPARHADVLVLSRSRSLRSRPVSGVSAAPFARVLEQVWLRTRTPS